MAKGYEVSNLERGTVGGARNDRLFEVLASGRRRATLEYLRETDTPVSFAELTAEIAHRERQSPSVDLDREKWADVETALAHAHLPILDDARFVQYDEDEESVTLGEQADLAWPHLEAIEGEDDADDWTGNLANGGAEPGGELSDDE